MQHKSSIGFSTRLILAFSLAVLLGAVVGATGYVAIDRIHDSLTDLYDSNFTPVTELAEVNIHAQAHRVNTLQHIIAPDDATMERLVTQMKTDEAQVGKSVDFFRNSDTSDDEKASLGELDTNWKAYLAVVAKVIAMSEVGQDAEAANLMNGEGVQRFTGFEKAADKLFELNKTQAADSYGAADTSARTAAALLVAVLAVGVALLAALGFFIVRNLLGTLGAEPADVVEIAHRIAGGDLLTEIRGSDRAGSVLHAMRDMQANLRRIVENVSRSSRDLMTAAGTMAELSRDSSQRAAQQNDAASAIAASVEEMTVSINHINESAHEAQQISSAARKEASDGRVVISRSVQEVERIETSVSDTSIVIGTLESESASISAIVQVIREIAEQTNLLALNAAIEAARA
jgi:methyl-accepting chemotaxis protein